MTAIQTKDGLSLEAKWDDAAGSVGSVAVVCHPHPLDRGTMYAPLLQSVTASLNAAGIHVLRFNFRGVGSSEGAWDQGVGEVHDVAAAVEAARLAFPTLPLGIAGWSFGATVSLSWQVETGSALPWVGIAPGIHTYRGSTVPDVVGLAPADRLIVFCDRDQFASVDSMEHFATRTGARLELLTGSDHFFHFRHDTVGSLVAAHLKAN